MRALLFLIFCLVCIPSYAANIKIGFIDINTVVTSLSQYKDSIDSISREFEPKKQELLDLFNHIELLRANIESNKNTSSSKSLNEELKNLAKLELNFKEETEFWQKTMNNKKLILLNNIEMIVNQAINEYATQEEYDLILYENVAFASDKVNITEEIIKKIEKQGL
ncbi:MAG: OmpH family outer membrane protein [Candidatus Pseudothioglobus sp.]